MASVICIIVTYNPLCETLYRELAAISQWHVTIIDNSSDASIVDSLRLWVSQSSEIRSLIQLTQNHGIAAAHNIGLRLAHSAGYEFALLLDHDSIPSEGLVEKLYDVAKARLEAGDNLAAVGAKIVDPRSGKEHGFYSMQWGLWRASRCSSISSGALIPCEFLNSSGSLIYLPAWERVGIFDENFFIDHVETDWYMRARHMKFQVYGLCFGQLEHYMGDDIARWWFFGWRYMPRRSPRRHYTIVRNSLWMYRRNYVPLTWKLNNFLKLLFTLGYFSIFDKDRLNQFRQIMRGLKDGILAYPGDLRSTQRYVGHSQ